MRKNYFLRTALSLLVLLCSFAPSWGAYDYAGNGTFKLVNSADGLTSGYYVLVSNEKAMSTTIASKPAAVDVTVTNGEIINPGTAIVWKIEKSDTYYCLSNSSENYLGYSSSTNFKSYTAATDSKTHFEASYTSSSTTFHLKISGQTRAILYRGNNSNQWGAYSVNNANNGEYFDPQLYKLDESAASLTEATISFDGITGDVTKYLSEEGYEFTVTTNSTATVQYSSSNTEVAEITDGLVVFNAPGETIIKAWVEQNDEYTAAETFYTLTVVDDSDPQLSFPESITDPYTVDLSLGSFDSKATAKSTGAITYASSVEEVAMIDENGEVVLMGAGETEISATIAAAGTYVTKTISYKLIVTKTESFKKATSISDGRYIIAYADGQVAMNTTNEGKFFNGTAVTITDDVIKTADATIIWEITQEADGNYSIKNGDIYLSLTANDNNAFIGNGYNDNSAWTISVSADGVATITNIAYDNRSLKYNSSSPRFACYASGQKSLTLYRFDDGKKVTAITFPEELGIVGNKVSKYYVADETFSSAVTVTLDDVVDATVPVAYSSDNEAVATIDAATGLVTLKGEGSTVITATVEATAGYRAASVSYTLNVVLVPTPVLTFDDESLTGEVAKTTEDEPFSSKVAVTLNGVENTTIPVKYSSSVETVATISDAGEVTIVGAGETVIKAEVEAIEGQYNAASVEYTLVVSAPAVMKTFKKVTGGAVTGGEYLLVYKKNGGTTIAMNNTLTGSGENTRLDDTDITTLVAEDGSISTDDASIMWTLTKEDAENNYWSISNSGSYAACTKDGNYAQYVSSYDNSGNTTSWTISASKEDFKIQSVAYDNRYLQYNSSSSFWGGYTGTQQDPMLYKLYDGTYTVMVRSADESYGSAYIGTEDAHSVIVNDGEPITITAKEVYSTEGGYSYYEFLGFYLNGERAVAPSECENVAEGKYKVIYNYTIPAVTTDAEYVAHFATATGINEVDGKVALYYADGKVYTNLAGEIAIYNATGSLVRRADVAPVDVEDLPNGVYFVKVNGKTLKFVK